MQERTEFYQKGFHINRVKRWFSDWDSPLVFAAVVGRHTRIYPARFRRDWRKTILIDEYETISDLPSYLVQFSPESAYYDRNIYTDWEQARKPSDHLYGLGKDFGQEIAIDIDPENYDCPIHGTLDEKMRKRQGLSFCHLELQLAKQQTLELLDILPHHFSDIRLVYSGRGFHIHVLDKNAFYWTRKERLSLARNLSGRGYAMDEWVLAGGMRLIRLPYSLNGLVSRVAIPLRQAELERFDPIEDSRCIPNFLPTF